MAKEIYIDGNGNEQLVSGTINNAEMLPIQSGSATDTKSYIDTGLSGKVNTSDNYKWEDISIALTPNGNVSPYTHYGDASLTGLSANSKVVGCACLTPSALTVPPTVAFNSTHQRVYCYGYSANTYTIRVIYTP